MKPSEIKAALLLRGITQSELAEIIKVDRSRINEVIHGRSARLEIRRMIASAIEKPINEVFPDERYRRASGRIRVPSSFYQQAMAA